MFKPTYRAVIWSLHVSSSRVLAGTDILALEEKKYWFFRLARSMICQSYYRTTDSRKILISN